MLQKRVYSSDRDAAERKFHVTLRVYGGGQKTVVVRATTPAQARDKALRAVTGQVISVR